MRVRISCCFPATSREGRCERDASTTLPDARLGGQQRDGRPGTARRQCQASGAPPPQTEIVRLVFALDISSEQKALRDSAIRARAPDLVKALRTLNVVISLDWAIVLLGAYSSEALPRALALTARYVAGRTRKMRSRFCGPHGWGSTPGWLQQLLQT